MHYAMHVAILYGLIVFIIVIVADAGGGVRSRMVVCGGVMGVVFLSDGGTRTTSGVAANALFRSSEKPWNTGANPDQ